MFLCRLWFVFFLMLVTAGSAQARSVLPPITPTTKVVPVAPPVVGRPLSAEEGATPESLIRVVQPSATETEARPLKILRAEEVLPQSLYAFVSIEGPSRLLEEVKSLKIAGLWDEPMVGEHISGTFDSLELMFKPGEADPKSLTGMMGAVGLTAGKLLNIFPGQVALGVSEGEKGVNFYFVAQFEEGQESIQDIVEEFGTQVEIKHPEVVVTPALFRDMEVRNFELPDGRTFGYTYIENLLIISSGRGAIEDLIEGYLDPASRAFVTTRAFQGAYGRLGEGAMVFYVIDVPKLCRSLGKSGKLTALVPPAGSPERYQELYKEMRAGKFLNVGIVAGSAFTMAGGVRDSIQIEAADPALPFLASHMPGAAQGELRLKTAAFAPLDSVLYCCSQDFQKVLGAYSLKTSDNVLLAEQLKNIQDKISIDITQTVLPLLKGEFAYAVMVSPGRPCPDVIVVSELSDTEQAMEIMDVVKNKLGARGAVVPIGARLSMLYYKPLERSWLSQLNYSPGVAIDGNFVIFGTSVDAVRKAVRQHRFAGSSSIQQSISFKLATEDLPQNLNTLFYMDLGRVVDLIYNAVLPVISQLIPSEAAVGGVNLSNLPPPESISQHLVPVAIGTRLDETTLYIDAYSPIGTLSVGLLSLATLTDTIGSAGAEAANVETASNLRKLGLGLHFYAVDFDRFPLALSELYPIYLQDFTTFTSPTGKRDVNSRDDIDTRSDYVYVPGVRLNDLSETIICYTRSYVHEDGMRTILMLDNSIKMVSPAEFQAMMATQGYEVPEATD